MVDYSSDDVQQLIDRMDRLIARFGGQMQNTGNSNASNAAKAESLSLRQKFNSGLRTSVDALELLHGSASGASYALKLIGVGGAFGVAIDSMIRGFTHMTQTYSKLTDVGQNFGGSIFQMQKQAADSGMTLEEFGTQVIKSSTLVAQMGDSHTKGAVAFTKYQMSVRDSLSEFGMFGMTLSQVNDAAADYAETQRVTGQWGKLNETERQRATSDFIKEVTDMAAATGKSREEIMKMVNQLERNPMAAAMAANLNKQQKKAYDSMLAGLSSLPGQSGKIAAEQMQELVQHQGRIWETQFGQSAIAHGQTQVNDVAMERYNRMMRGEGWKNEDYGTEKALGESLVRAAPTISAIDSGNPSLAPGGAQLETLGTELQNLDAEMKKIQERQADAKRRDDSGITQAMEMFESNFNKITAAFRDGLYGQIVKYLAPGTTDPAERMKAFAEGVEKTKDIMSSLGEAVGFLFGIVVELTPAIKWVVGSVISLGEGIDNFLKKFMPGWAAALITVGTGVAAFMGIKKLFGMLTGAMRIDARVVNVFARGLGSGFGGGGGGGGSAAGGWRNRAGSMYRTMGGNVGGSFSAAPSVGKGLLSSGGGMMLRGVAGGIVAAVADEAGKALIDAMPIGEEAKSQAKDALNWASTGATVGFAVGGPFGALAGAAIGAVGALIVDNFPSKEDMQKKIKEITEPELNQRLGGMQNKIDNSNKDLATAREKLAADTAAGATDKIADDNDRIAKLLTDLKSLGEAQLDTQKKAQKAQQDLADGSWMANGNPAM